MKRLLLLWLCILGIASASYAATSWVLVTSVSELTDGTEIIFTNSDNTKGFSSVALSSSKGQVTTVTASDDVLTSGVDNCQKFRIDIVNGKYTFYALTDKGYLTQTTAGKTNISYVSSNTSTNQQATITYPSGKTAPKIKFDVEASESIRYFEYYSSNDVFGTYSASSPSLHIFKKVTTAEGTQCAAPIFSPAAGTYDEAQTVTLSTATDGASIYYTTDGNEPSTSSTPYSDPITVSSSQTIKAIATKSGLTDSEVATAAYTINVVEPLPAGNWVLVKSTSSLHDGDKVILVGSSVTKAFSSGAFNGGRGTGVEVDVRTTPEGGETYLTPNSSCQIFTLGISDSKYTLFAEGKGYLNASAASGNGVEWSNTITNNSKATIESGSDNRIVYHYDISDSGRNLSWGGSYFGTYSGDNLTIYRLDTSVPAPTVTLNETVVASGTSMEVKKSDIFEVTAPTGTTLELTVVPEANAAVLYDDEDAPTYAKVSFTGPCVMTVKAVDSSNVESSAVTLTFTVEAPTVKVFELVESIDEFVPGDDYILVGIKDDGTVYVNTTIEGTNTYISVEDAKSGANFTAGTLIGATNVPSIITLPLTGSAVKPVTIQPATTSGNTSKYTMLLADGTFVYDDSNKDFSHTSSPSVAEPERAAFSLTIGSKTGANDFQSHLTYTSGEMSFNGNDPRFKPYATSQGKQYLYRCGDNSVKAPIFAVQGSVSSETYLGHKCYNNAIDVKVTSRTPGATIKYTTSADDHATEHTFDAATPIHLDGGPVTVRAWAEKDGMNDSEVVEETFYFRAATPTITITDLGNNTKQLTINSATTGATLYYTSSDEWNEYDPDNKPQSNVPGTYLIHAKAEREGYYASAEAAHIEEITDPALNQPFRLLTSMNDLADDDEIIIVAKNSSNEYKAMAPQANNDNYAGLANVTVNGDNTISLVENQKAVEVIALEKVEDNGTVRYKLRPTITSAQESSEPFLYYYAPTGSNNYLKIGKESADNVGNKVMTSISVKEGVATITFVNSIYNNTARKLQFNSDRFATYTSSQTGIQIYHRSLGMPRVARPEASIYEGVYREEELAGGVTLSCDTEGASIWYTTDGVDPRESDNAKLYAVGETINVLECKTIRAYATKDGMRPSPDLIAVYHIFPGNRVYTRVTPNEVQNLRDGDRVIIVASPSNNNDYYALGKNQIDRELGDGTEEQYRPAVRINAPDANGQLVLSEIKVQPLILLSGRDDFDDFDWRLYSSGTYLNDDQTDLTDGYLYSAGENNSLATVRIDDPDNVLVANADVRFLHSTTNNGGNEYGGVTVQFDSPDGHDETYPNYLGLRHMPDETWRFNCYTTEYIADNSTEIYFVSLFKAYDPAQVAPPTFTPDGGQTVAEAIDESETISLDYVDLGYGSTTNRTIKYAIDPTIADPNAEVTVESISSWQTYTEPFYFDSGLHTVYAYLEIDDPVTSSVRNSSVVKRIYSVSKEEIFELVTTGTTIKESDRLIFVNNIPYDGVSDHDYYAMTTVTYGSDTHWIGRKINEAPSGDGQPRRLRVPAPVAGEEHPIAIFNVELDGSGSESSKSRPYLIRLGDKYLEATKAKGLQLTELKPIEERDKMNCGFNVVDAHVADSTMDPEGYSGDFLYYLRKDADTPTTTRGNVDNKAVVVFSGFVNGDTILTTLRFVGTGNYRHFNNYEYKEKKVKVEGKEIICNKPNDYTYPVSIYRATESVMPPSLTVYPLDFEASRTSGTQVFSDKGYSTDVTTFYNPVKIVIKDNPKTAGNASIKYAWTKTREAAPVSSEYTKAPTKPVTMVLDGFSLTINDEPATGRDGTAISAAGAAYMSTAIRAMSELNGVVSPSVPHGIHFKTAAPKLTVASTDGTTKIVRVDRPEVYTLGSVLRYTLDGTNPTESTESVVLPGETIEVPAGTTLKVGAFKPGFETQIATYSQYTYTPQAKAVQLLELTGTGRLMAEGEYDYMTYRTSGNNYFIKKDGDNVTLTQADNDKFEAIMAEPGNYNWTADYYVFAANKDDFDALVSGKSFDESGALKIKIGSDVVEKKVDAVASEANLDGTTANYYGAILNRSGALGQDNITVEMTYSIDGVAYEQSALTRVKPAMPMPTGLKYTYDTEEYSTVGDYTDDVTLGSHSAVLDRHVDLIFPAIFNGRSNFSPRALTCLYNFRKPNVAADVLKDYDLQYSVVITNSYTLDYEYNGTRLYNPETGKWTLPADFADIMAGNPDLLYIEKTMFDITTDGQNQQYALRIDKVTPSDDVNPVIQIADTKYVSKEDASSDDASYDYHDVKALEAESSFDETASDNEEYYKPKFGRIDLRPAKNPLGTYDWYYFGHPKHLDRGSSYLRHPGASDNDFYVKLEPSLYHLEVYVEAEDGGIEPRPADSFKPSYLHDRDKYYGGLNHKVLLYDPDNWNCYYVAEKDEDDNYNPDYEKNHALLGQVVMYNVPRDKTLKAVLTPVYVFQRDPKERLTLNEGDTYTPLYEAGTMGGGANKPSGAMSAPRRAPKAVDSSNYVVLRGTPMRSTSAVDDGTTGVENVIDNADARAEYYTIQGVRVENPGPGLYIEVRGSQARKVLLK